MNVRSVLSSEAQTLWRKTANKRGAAAAWDAVEGRRTDQELKELFQQIDRQRQRFNLHAEVVKIEPEQRRFWGYAYVTRKHGEQVVDHSGDVIDTPETLAALEDAFYRYAKDSRSGDLNHEQFGAATLIEQVVLTKDKAKLMGIDPDALENEGVWVGYEAEKSDAGDVLWDGVKSGELSMLSIVGRGQREPI